MEVMVFVFLALLGGAVLPIQIGLNAQLKEWVGSPVLAALASFAVGALALLAAIVAFRVPWPGLGRVAESPWWVWIGGLFGAFYVSTTIILGPRLGATVLAVLTVAGQVLASLAIDHYGWVGFARQPVNVWRILGVALLLAGVALIRRS